MQAPRIIVGTSRMGSPLPNPFLGASARERAYAPLDAAVEVGCHAFDLAASYMLGGTERFVGGWIASRRNRDRLFLVSKGGHPYPIVRPHRLSSDALTADLHASLKRLGTERLDLYLLHKDDDAAPLDAILETMTKLQRQGKFDAWGVSNWSHERIAAIDALARSAGVPSVAASSPHFSLVAWEKPPFPGSVSIAGERNREAREYYEKTGLPVLAWSPLGGGFLGSPSKGAVVGGSSGAYGNAEGVAARERATTLARRRGVSLSQIALAYVFAQPFPTHAIVAASTPEKMKANVEATKVTLSPAETRWLEVGGPAPT